MFELIRQRIERVDTDKAEEFLKLNNYIGQRKLNERKARELEEKQEDGRFLIGHFALARKDFNGGETVLVNGQKQSTSIINTGIPMTAVVSLYSCPTPEDLALLFRQFDGHETRSLQQCIMAEAHALKIDWCPTIVARIASAAAFLEGKAQATKDEKVEILQHYLREGDFINEILGGHTADSPHMMRASVIIPMIMTWKKSHEDAKKFWMNVRDGEGLKKHMPEYRLRNYLMQVKQNHGRGASYANRVVTAHEIISKCLTAWNASRKGEATALKYFSDKPIPKAI
jgi:hypothetical protein